MKTFKESFVQATAQWKLLNRGTEEERRQADAFYKDHILPEVMMHFREKYAHSESCENLILTLGTSYEPLVLSILALRPERVLIMHSTRTRPLLDDVIELTGLKPSRYISRMVNSENPLKLYQVVKEVYEEWDRPGKIYVDFTSGTKSMTAGCAMAGSVINAKFVYIASHYLADLRKPEPGSETLSYIENPYEVFGDIERDRAVTLFNGMDYASAAEIFDELRRKVPGLHEFEALGLLSKAYDNWDSLNLAGAYDYMSKCCEILSLLSLTGSATLLAPHKSRLEQQLRLIGKLKDIHEGQGHRQKDGIFHDISIVMANIYCNAMRKEKQHKYEMSSLLLYRLLEMVAQKRLWNLKIDTEDAEYAETGFEPQALLDRVNALRTRVKGFHPIEKLDKQISLIAGFILLAALEDDIIRTKKPDAVIGRIESLKNKVDLRNKSIFAHGFTFIDADKYSQFKAAVDEYVDRFFHLEELDRDEAFGPMNFITLSAD
ncbi:TIGR02710 family CRISPR-associated CARF protein [Paenibacillus sabinae]|uniref:CRISPR-associated protein n=1 Tax=Paenibacillus sabinae T27 TaxID=1268072 RepID=X4ZTA9_9BACL|nr:TIGR02710 family CRISPR-associated CARF protein [Paenibacillus sabinae]AHV95638.1 CRISPR-associated protein [Paenibacillus sabinae T27]